MIILFEKLLKSKEEAIYASFPGYLLRMPPALSKVKGTGAREGRRC
jgi:hypothetical protein